MTVALALTGGAAGATPAVVRPAEAASGDTVSITGPPGPVTLEPLDGGVESVVATIPVSGSVRIVVPQVPTGTRYRIVVAGAAEAPVLTVTERLDGKTSGLLLGFGFVLVLGLAVAGLVVHRRWRDAVS